MSAARNEAERLLDRRRVPPVTAFYVENREAIEALYAIETYDMRDIANALLDLYATGEISFAAIDALFVTEGWSWPGEQGAGA